VQGGLGEGTDRYRNPDEDLPAAFAAQRTAYYETLHLPLDSGTFVRGGQDELAVALTALDHAMPRYRGMSIVGYVSFHTVEDGERSL